jgi:AraC family transcriptional regulator of adaptative response/methylated-DNA-[protein]-cysteine methyltransferase
VALTRAIDEATALEEPGSPLRHAVFQALLFATLISNIGDWMEDVGETWLMTAFHDPRWSSIVARDKAADGSFYYSVVTPGVYCRPSCTSRLARPENVRFHATPAAAEKSGFRACRRCRPNGLSLTETNAAKIAKACRLLELAEELPSLEALATSAGMSTFHFHRTFKAVTGLTPRDYGMAHRTKRVRKTLANSTSVTAAI